MAVPFSSLTADQQAVWNNWSNLQRSWCIAQAKANNLGAAIQVIYTAQIQAILVALNDNSVVPNTSGLAGSQSLDSDSESAIIEGHIDAVLTACNDSAHRQLWAKAAGGGNIMGTS